MNLMITWKALEYYGGTEEADESEIGEQITGDVYYYILEHLPTDWQLEGYDESFTPKTYTLKNSIGCQTLIIENHKGKLVKVTVNNDLYRANFKDVLMVYGISNETVKSITVNKINTGIKATLTQESILEMLDLLNHDYETFPVGFYPHNKEYRMNIDLINNESYSFIIDLSTKQMQLFEQTYTLTTEFSRTFKTICPEWFISNN